jgi:tryptophanyl-tRNA synthetase
MSRILLTDSSEELHRKIKKALTDSEPDITYDPVNRPGVSNLIEMLSHFDSNGKTCTELADELRSTSMKSLKEVVATTIDTHLRDIRERYFEIISKEAGYLEGIAEEGALQARANAAITMTAVRTALGL